MSKAVLSGLALVVTSACGGGVAGAPSLALINGQLLGTWGGNNAVLMALDTTAHVHIGCTAGDTKQAIVTDDQGRFDVPGMYNITLYPVARGPAPGSCTRSRSKGVTSSSRERVHDP